jgi:hypothetical protein
MNAEINARTSCLTTSGESAKESQQTAARLRQQILEFACNAQAQGITINDAERLIEDHKGHSVSPRFAELVRLGRLVRIVTGRGATTVRFPQGAPRYRTRYDEETRRNVIVHWLPEFAPMAIEADQEKKATGVQCTLLRHSRSPYLRSDRRIASHVSQREQI